LRYCDFRGSDLSHCDFSGSDLSYCDFRGSDLRYCDLRYCDFRYCDFRYCDFRHAKGVILLPVQDPRGYSFVFAIECNDGWRVRAGCRDFTIEQALEHWGDSYKGDRGIGDAYLYAVNWLKEKVSIKKGDES